MPQVDLEDFVPSVCTGGSDRKIACETFADDDHDNKPYAASPADYPPESYFLSKDASLEWLSRNDFFFERKDSQRRNSTNLNPNDSNSNSNSQRFLAKPKASIIGLPKPQNTCFNEVKQRRNVKNRLILKRVESRMKSDPSQLEPSSPMVSCIGRVRSKRERCRRIHRQKSNRVDPVVEKMNPVNSVKENRVKKSGFVARFKAIFRIGGGGCKDVSARERHDIRSRLPVENVMTSVDKGVVAPGLGGMTRFVSGRRTDIYSVGVVDVA